MSNSPFNIEYASDVITSADAVTKSHAPTLLTAEGVNATTANNVIEKNSYGFEPERYGLGKPKRIVTKGKIVRE